jgi:hypothetical protein
MIYYSTGKNSYLPRKGNQVICENKVTIDILKKKGAIVDSLEELEVIVPIVKAVETEQNPVEVTQPIVVKKRKGNPNWAKK